MQTIYCEVCGEVVGAVNAPTAEQIKETLKASVFRGAAAFITPNISEDMIALLSFRCTNHINTEVRKDGG